MEKIIRVMGFTVTGMRIEIESDGKDVAHTYLYILKNDLHDKPFGFAEDVFVVELYRGQGLMKILMEEIEENARKNNCYKLIATSRDSRTELHEVYEKMGFARYGVEFRKNL